VALDWKETGGPQVTTPTHQGFGGRVIRHLAVHEPSGTVNLAYEPDGVRCRLEFTAASA
jgi:two-component sensor histidine kinase